MPTTEQLATLVRDDLRPHLVAIRHPYDAVWTPVDGANIRSAQDDYDRGYVEIVQQRLFPAPAGCFALLAIKRKVRVEREPKQKFSYAREWE